MLMAAAAFIFLYKKLRPATQSVVVETAAMNRQAQKLITKFHDASVYRMARGNAKEATTQPLFHYTTEQALYKIIQSETFWFTSIYYMDDDAELSFGFALSCRR